MKETAERIVPQLEAFALRLQFPMVIPEEIRHLEVTRQLPEGEIAYHDVNEPDTLRLVARETFRPVTKKGIEVRLNLKNLDKFPRRFAAVILKVPPRTPENAFDETIRGFSALLKRTSKREEGIIIEQHLGAIFVVEGRGEDQRVGWRQEQLRRAELVVERRSGGSVIISGDRIISFARRPMQRGPTDLTQGERSRYMIGPFLDQIETLADEQGFRADTSSLREEARKTRYPPGTIANLRDGGKVVFEGEDSDGKRIVVDRTGGSEVVTPSRKALEEMVERAKPVNGTGRPEMHKPGDKVPTDIECGECGSHFQEEYYGEPGRERMLLFRDIVCHGAHSDGYPKYMQKRQYSGYLGRLPANMTRAKKASSLQ